jgi:hypothetical protein
MRTKAIAFVLFAPFVLTCLFMAGRAYESQQIKHWPPVPRALPEGVTKFHDASDEVTCWKIDDRFGNAISCLPDIALTHGRIEGGAP